MGVSERSTNAITLSVPDRDADGVSEDIRYSWSGTAGASIYRQYNAQTALPVLDNVHVFQLGYDLVNVVFENPPGGETLFAQHDATTDVSTMSPSSSVRVSQCFAPAVPSGGTGWRVKGVALVCRQKGDPGGDVIIDFALPLSDGRPGTVVCQATVKESAMGTMLAWQSFPVTACGSYLSPSQSLCIVVRGSATDSCELKKHDKNAAAAGRYFYTSTNSGSTWTLQTGKALLFQVFGNVQGVGDADLIASRLGQVRWQLQVGGESSAMIHAGTQTANLPE